MQCKLNSHRDYEIVEVSCAIHATCLVTWLESSKWQYLIKDQGSSQCRDTPGLHKGGSHSPRTGRRPGGHHLERFGPLPVAPDVKRVPNEVGLRVALPLGSGEHREAVCP